MARIITFSTKFPSYHSKAGQPTYFVEKIWKSLYDTDAFYGISEIESNYTDVFGFPDKPENNIHNHLPKYQTIRKGNRWKLGDFFQPMVWGNDINPKSKRGGPYHSKPVRIAPDIQIKKLWDFKIIGGDIFVNKKQLGGITEGDFEFVEILATNDGLDRHDLLEWFRYPKSFDGQIICWNDKIEY